MAAARDPHHHRFQKKNPSLLVLSLLLLLSSLFLALPLLFTSSTTPASASPPSRDFISKERSDRRACNYSGGNWVYDPASRPGRYDHTCKEIFKGWNCIARNKSNALDLVKWRWKPNGCELPPLDPFRFLQRYRDTNIGIFLSLASVDECKF